MFPIPVDGRFLTKPVDELFQKHELLTVPFITGVTSDEGGWLVPKVSEKQTLLSDWRAFDMVTLFF